jgi:N-acetylmuramoyl-L-alanine amidase
MRAAWRLSVVAIVLASAVGVAPRVLLADLATLRVRDTTFTLDVRRGVAMVEAAPLARLMGGTWTREADGRYVLAVGTVRATLIAGLPYARTANTAHALVVAPQLRGAALWIPLQVVTELIPRLDPTFGFDRARGELRLPPRAAAIVATPPARPAPPPAATPVKRVTSRRVIVDPGHGGKDVGMRARLPNGTIVWEKDIALGVSRRVAAALKDRGVGVHLTRDRDTLIALADRGRIANQQRGDLFLSIHVNAANPGWANSGGARGFETYFLAEAKTEDAKRVAQMENEVVKFETEIETSATDPLGFIINDMAQNEHLRESLELAAAIQAGLAKRHPGPNRGVKQAGFAVLVRSFMPAVLIEIGFGSNPAEAAWMHSAAGQQALAESIADATLGYLEQYEKRVSGGGA